MARDKTARERDDSEFAVDRRSFLGVAGASAASALGVGALATTSESASAADYRTVEVPAGQTESFRVGSGETLENLLIDMTADGASAKIYAEGDGWTIRNVAFKGNHPGGHYLFTPSVPNSDGTATVENLYMGDGQTEGSGKGAIWVQNSHRGTIDFRNVNVQHFIDNGLYGMDPGYSGAGAVVNVYDSFFNSNNIANIRIGSADGRTCVVENCVVRTGSTRACDVGCSSPGAKNSRGVWAWWGPVEVRDSDVEGGLVEKDGGSLQTTNTRTGADADTSDANVPSGVPMTAEEAASGGSSSGSSSSTATTTEEDDTADAEGTVLELVAGDDASNVSYEFTVEGSVEKRTSAGDVSAESNDTVSDNGDGTVTVSGVAGNGFGDSFLVDGDVVSMDLDESQWTVRWAGEEVGVDDLVLPNKLVIDGSDHPRLASTYTFEVSGTAKKSAALGSVNPNDTIEEGEISGRVIGGKDGYRFSGEITGFSLDGPATVRVEDGS